MTKKIFFLAIIIYWLTSILFIPSVIAKQGEFDYSYYQKFLNQYLTENQQKENFILNVLDYDAIYNSKANKDSLYNKIISQFLIFDTSSLKTKEEKISFWINAYNIGAIKMIIDHYPVESIRSFKISWTKNPWGKKVLKIGKTLYSLTEIEHTILLGRFNEPKIHFSIVCASTSCPDLRAEVYRGETLYEQMADQARNFLNKKGKGLFINKTNGTVYFSQIFKFDKKTFPKGAKDAISFIREFIEPEKSEYLSSGDYKIDYLDYDWSLNSTLATEDTERK